MVRKKCGSETCIRLNLGSGDKPLAGYENIDIKAGVNVAKLPHADASVDEVRASHVLEHFSHVATQDIIREWARALKPGGTLKIAVPDFDWCVDQYRSGGQYPIEGYIMGGHVDEHDAHCAIFNKQKLTALLRNAGLVNVHRFKGDADDCSRLDVSLNLVATKPMIALTAPKKIVACMSVPRLGFMDNFFCAFSALQPLGITLMRHTGAFWGQCLERCIGEAITGGADAILTIDYDTVFRQSDVQELIRLYCENPQVGAMAALQVHRSQPTPLMTLRGTDGKNERKVDRELFDTDLTEVATAHFGLTLIRVASLKQLPHPWFKGEPDANGQWSDDRIDDDIWFWRQWEKAGFTLCQANRIPVGHAEMMIRWPDANMSARYQHPNEFWATGKPAWVWQ